MKNYKKSILGKKTTACILSSIFVLGILTSCGKTSSVEMNQNITNEPITENNDEPYMSAKEFYNSYIAQKDTDISVSQRGNYIINGVELCDAVEPSENIDDTWEGYTVKELGLLKPEKMPNVIVDEAGNHGVLYDYVYYVYANDMNEKYGEHAITAEYANVWCSMGTETMQVLGGWEEYGKLCAQRGDIIK